jgi:phage-related protein
VALNLGELVAGLRADDAPFTRSLNRAELAMRGLTRDVNGQLRDINGRFVRDGDAMGRSLSHGIGNGARQAVAALGKVAPAAAALGVGLPVVAALATGLMGVAAAGAAAGLAVKAFSFAATPQMEKVTEVSKLAEEAQKAHAAGAEDAAEKQKAYADALRALPPATEATARAFIGMKKEYKSWSDGLASTTMPVFTKGIMILRSLLPMLTPFVKAAASAIGGFLDKVAVGVKSAKFKEWAADMSAAAGPALANFLTFIKNLAVGFGGLLQAFLPASEGMTGGLVSMSEAFANWATSLKGSEGFAKFLELAKEGGTTLGQLAMAVGNLLVALGPLIGITTQVALALARIINALPPEVLSLLATTIAAVVIGMKAWALGATVVRGANALMASSTWLAISGWLRMMATGLMVYARIAASAALNAARTAAVWVASAARMTATWLVQIIRVALTTAAQFAMMAARAVAWAVVMAAQWLVAFWPIALVIAAVAGLVALIIIYWDQIKAFTVAAWGYIVGFVRGAATGIIAGVMLLARIPGMVLGFFTRMKDAAIRQASSMVSWMRGLPGRLGSALGNMATLLVSKGADVIRGLWNGIKSMGGWLWNKVKSFVSENVVNAAKSFLHIGSPSKLMADQIGQWIPAGIAQGVTGNAGVLDSAMNSLVSTPTPSAVMAMGGAAVGGAAVGGAGRGDVVTLRGGDAWGDQIIQTIRDRVGIGAGGDVQLYLGKRK